MHRVKSTSNRSGGATPLSLVTLVTMTLGLLIGFISFGDDANASSIGKVRGKQAIVVFDGGETPAPGDKFFALENGKRKAILEVVEFKKGKARVKILKGTAKEGMNVAGARRKGKPTATAAAADDDSADATMSSNESVRNAGKATLFKDMTVGAVGGYAMDSQTVNIGGQAVAMTGTGFSFKGFADVPVVGDLSLLPRVGAEQFNVQNGTAKTSILYAVADLILKYSFGTQGFVPFAMGGLGIHFPISKSSEFALDANKIASTTVFYFGGGFNYAIGASTYFQLTAEYGYFPPNNDVTTSWIAARSGLGFRF